MNVNKGNVNKRLALFHDSPQWLRLIRAQTALVQEKLNDWVEEYRELRYSVNRNRSLAFPGSEPCHMQLTGPNDPCIVSDMALGIDVS